MSNTDKAIGDETRQGVIIGRNIINNGVEIPAEVADKEFWQIVVRYQFWYSMFGLVSALSCILSGITLILNGIIGGGKWSANALGLVISDAPPGIALFFIGLIIASITSFSVKPAPKPK
jgi:hypothetical protein